MTGLQLVLTGGALVGLGLAVLLWRLVPAEPDLGQALGRLSPDGARTAHHDRAMRDSKSGDVRDVLGRWAQQHLPAGVWGRVRPEDLAILNKTRARFYGEKLVFAVLGLSAAPFLSGVLLLGGLGVPVTVPVVGSAVLGMVMWFVPSYNVVDDARKARLEFSRALGAFIDLVALERNAGSGPRQSMEAAAAVGDSWVFVRLAEELARTRWSGLTPWEAIRRLGADLGMPELGDLADIMRLSGEDGAQIYAQLRARSASMRSAMLHAQKAQANEVSERMTLPMSLLGVVFLLILIAPSMLRLVFDGG